MSVYSAIAVYGLFQPENIGAMNLATGVLRIALGLLAVGVLLRWGWVDEPLEGQVRLMGASFEADFANLDTKTKIRLIVLVTMLSLLLELVMIRWLASVFPVYSFYKNFTMLACFLGLGAGYAVAEKQPCAPAMVLPMLALFVGVITLLRYDTGSTYLIFSIGWLSSFDMPVYFLLGASFIICACICYPVGQLCGKLLHSSNSLNAYSLNLGGSILGVIALFVMSLYWTPPVIWFAVTGGMMLLFVLSRDQFLSVGIASFCVLLGILAWPVQPETQRIYSPYQLLERTAKADGLMQILSGGSYYQKVYNFADIRRAVEDDADRFVRAYYEFPYNFKKAPERVAIVGAGSGNDVATALRMGASHVDAIEIDPAIAFLGKKYHPEHPYDDPRVNLEINDARNFFRTANQQYDLIVYGVLDSHTALSHASNLRVDSYVYTREGIAEAYRLLKPGGVMSISFTLVNDALGFKLSKILSELPGAGKPLAVRVRYDYVRTTAFVAKKGGTVTMPDKNAFASIGFTDVSNYFSQPYPESSVPTDDWPFFYMVERSFPVTYMIALGMVLLAQLLLRAQDHRLHRPDRPQLCAVLLSGLRLHAGGDQGHHRTRPASRRHLVRDRGRDPLGADHGLPGQSDRDADGAQLGRAGLCRTVREPSGWLFYRDQPWRVDVRAARGAAGAELSGADHSAVLRRHHLLQPDRRGQDQHLDRVRLQSDGRAVRRGDGIQFDVFRICLPLSAGAGILLPRLGILLEAGAGAAAGGVSRLGGEPINSGWSADVRFGAHFGLKSDITALPKVPTGEVDQRRCG